jgi:hypothetical protein
MRRIWWGAADEMAVNKKGEAAAGVHQHVASGLIDGRRH